MDCISETLHRTPCHPSPHGSPPMLTHPGSTGDPRERYKLLIAVTNSIKTMPVIRFKAPCTIKQN
jgi:hypothetical protein